MTDHNRIEMELGQILKLQHQLSRILADAVNPLAGLAEAIETAADMPGVDGVWTWLRSAEGDIFRLEDAASLGAVLTLELDSFPSTSTMGRRLLATEEFVGTCADLWPEKAEILQDGGWRQLAVLPVVSSGQVVGALAAGRRQNTCVDDNCLWVLRALASSIASRPYRTRASSQ